MPIEAITLEAKNDIDLRGVFNIQRVEGNNKNTAMTLADGNSPRPEY
ncbi:hypothetical protein [Moellerella wisconsensis]|uniref:Uncharacterized protein n=2 Tax=Moellerella wisconsensis TaxID=158849 RepID=A0ACD3YB68_9GAMM|nr:hypothetical protein [Moellerella wisconsensis]UNH25469.1 hypothetical protein MNY68_07095 [Moellerella wisconsensis]UNH28657.1 hypothetical protein MNY64_07710 [Moellerella wisconsensis]UNH32110.1 hypothetical protein MNY72_07470 [Moellerella wisconsensis]UNH40260.1 hypothetical protein MNY70_07495 [Moellerella wisconsensis]UNH43797.1 hypothetical protein MNY66_07505 [Moellerella wisconsensis]